VAPEAAGAKTGAVADLLAPVQAASGMRASTANANDRKRYVNKDITPNDITVIRRRAKYQ
jgi:hypothetical protein